MGTDMANEVPPGAERSRMKFSAQPSHDLGGDVQAEARSILLGGIERIKILRPRLVRDPRPRVPHANDHVLAVLGIALQGGLKADLAAVGAVASTALFSRLRRTCSNCCGSARTWGKPRAYHRRNEGGVAESDAGKLQSLVDDRQTALRAHRGDRRAGKFQEVCAPCFPAGRFLPR